MYRRSVKPALKRRAQNDDLHHRPYRRRCGPRLIPRPAAEKSFFSPLRARKELQRLVCAEKENLDDRYDCEDQDEDYWEMYQDGNAAALFVRLEVVPSELILMSAGEKEEVKGSLEEETEAEECLSRVWRMQSDAAERDHDGEHH